MKRALLFVSFVWLSAATVGAQEYPNKVITMVVPFTAGGPTDTVARLLGAPMTKALKQQVIVQIEAPKLSCFQLVTLPRSYSVCSDDKITELAYSVAACNVSAPPLKATDQLSDLLLCA